MFRCPKQIPTALVITVVTGLRLLGSLGAAMPLSGIHGWRARLLCGSLGGIPSKKHLPRCDMRGLGLNM